MLFFFNSILLIALILSSINKKSPRRLLKFLFLPILLSLFVSLAIQFQLQVSEISQRQLFANLMVILWCLKSFSAYKSIKATLFKEILPSIRDSIYKKKFFTILFTVLKISLIQIICFSSVFSLNYLSGYSSLNYLDILGISLCILGISIEFICERQIKNAKKKGGNLIIRIMELFETSKLSGPAFNVFRSSCPGIKRCWFTVVNFRLNGNYLNYL